MNAAGRRVSDAERRARLGIRHALSRPVSGTAAAAEATVCLHATEPASIYLSALARSGASRDDVDRAMFDERSIVRQLAMRRTVFAFPRDLLPAVRGSAAARVAAQQAALLARTVVAGGLTDDGTEWVERACAQTLDLLHEGPATTAQLRARLDVLSERVAQPERGLAGKPTPVAGRVLTVLAASGAVVRGANAGGWTVSRPHWTTVESWVGHRVEPWSEAAGYAELVRRWLWSYGPGTEDDLVWWLGATKAAVRLAIDDVGAVRVELQNGSPAWLHPDDTEPVTTPAPWAALLPALDPTTMGWRGRTFYVDAETAAAVYDRAGNGRPTAWWNGRIVGSWRQNPDGTVIVLPFHPLSRSASDALERKARRLTTWLDGHVLASGFYT